MSHTFGVEASRTPNASHFWGSNLSVAECIALLGLKPLGCRMSRTLGVEASRMRYCIRAEPFISNVSHFGSSLVFSKKKHKTSLFPDTFAKNQQQLWLLMIVLPTFMIVLWFSYDCAREIRHPRGFNPKNARHSASEKLQPQKCETFSKTRSTIINDKNTIIVQS